MTDPPVETLCFLIEKLGPYHAARLQRASQMRAGNIVAIELAPQDQTYAWQPLALPADTGFACCPLPPVRAGALAASSLWQLLDTLRPATVFLNGWADAWAFRALAWCLRRGVPAVVMSDSQERDEPRVGWKEAIKRRFVRCCQAAFVAGQRHEEYIRALGMPADRISIGYDVVDNEYFAVGAQEIREDPNRWLSRLGLPKRHAFFLCVSRFMPKKNLPRLVQAFGRYRQRHRAAGGQENAIWHLVLLGDGEGREALESLIAREGLAPAVHLPGFRQYDELPGYYGLAGALVLASTSDQWGLAVNEAMAAGLPVLVSEACGCVPELVQDRINGHSFDPADVDGLADRLLQVATMVPDRRKAMGEAGRHLVAHWSLERFAEGAWQAADLARTAPCADRINLWPAFNSFLFSALARFRTP